MDLSIIILSYNTSKLTLKTLETVFTSLNNSCIKYEVLVLDNASTDNSILQINKYFQDKVKLIKSKINTGFAKGNNLAVKEAKGKYLLFLNSDIEVQDRGIERLFEFYKDNEVKYQFIGGKLFNTDLSPQASSGPFYSLGVVFLALFLRGDYLGLTRYSPNKVCIVDWVSGACFITRKTIFEQVGLFDENIFMYMEEIDLMYRAKKLGFNTAFYPGAKFIHLGTGSSNGRKQPILNVYRGFLFFYKKHHNKIALFWLKLILKTKAQIGYNLGVILNINYLKETYGEALKLV